jgi:hypothetical protein
MSELSPLTVGRAGVVVLGARTTPVTPIASLTKAQRKARDAEVERAHAMYFDYNQRRHTTSERFAEAGHPLARAYNAIAKLFFSMKYCSNASTRLIAYANVGGTMEQSASEVVSIHRPEICESWSVFREINGTYFGHVYPASPQWNDFVDATIATRFKHSNAHMGPNFIKVETTRTDVRRAFVALTEAFPCLRFSEGRDSRHFSIDLKDKPSVKAIQAAFQLVRMHFKPYLLPKGASDVDTRELPLPKKHFRLANVSEVTVTPTAIHVPLIPYGKEGATLLSDNVQKLLGLVEQGYPFEGDVESYLSKHFSAKEMRAMKRQYSTAG